MLYERSSCPVTGGDEPSPGRRLARQLLQWLLPCPCLGCKETVWETRGSLGLCPDCRGRLARWPRQGCRICGRRLEAGRLPGAHLPAGYRCGRCRQSPPPYDRMVSTWVYRPPLADALMALKFRRLDYIGDDLGRAMAEMHGRDLEDCDLVLPVPLYWTRWLTRGYNQAELIARPLARALDLPLARPLARRRATAHQSRLGRRARQRNLDHAFVVRRRKLARAAVRGRRLLLVDDVTTTGATLLAAARCLKEAGARSVVALTAARTPRAGELSALPEQRPGPPFV